jgi:hypothetical protein
MVDRMVIDVPTRTVVRVLGLVIVAAAAVKVIGAVSHVLTWVAVSLFLAIALGRSCGSPSAG